MIELFYDPLPKAFDLVPFRIGHSEEPYDFTWLEDNHEIVLKIQCEDGIFLLLRIPPGNDENHESRFKVWQPKNNLLDILGCGDRDRCERNAPR